MAVLGLRFCARAFSSCGKRGPLFIAMRGPLTIAASLVAEHRLQTRRLSNCGSRARLLRGTRDPPRPGLEPMSPTLAGRFSTTAPRGKPRNWDFCRWKVVNVNNFIWFNLILIFLGFTVLNIVYWLSTMERKDLDLLQHPPPHTHTCSLLPHPSHIVIAQLVIKSSHYYPM